MQPIASFARGLGIRCFLRQAHSRSEQALNHVFVHVDGELDLFSQLSLHPFPKFLRGLVITFAHRDEQSQGAGGGKAQIVTIFELLADARRQL
jgi:hypothetical protein